MSDPTSADASVGIDPPGTAPGAASETHISQPSKAYHHREPSVDTVRAAPGRKYRFDKYERAVRLDDDPYKWMKRVDRKTRGMQEGILDCIDESIKYVEKVRRGRLRKSKRRSTRTFGLQLVDDTEAVNDLYLDRGTEPVDGALRATSAFYWSEDLLIALRHTRARAAEAARLFVEIRNRNKRNIAYWVRWTINHSIGPRVGTAVTGALRYRQ